MSAGLEARCLQSPGSRNRLPSKDFDEDNDKDEGEMKILVEMSELRFDQLI